MTTMPQLRSMSFIDILDTAFRLYRAHFLTFVGIVALLQIPFIILYSLFQFTIGWESALNVTNFSNTPTFTGSSPANVQLIDFVIYYTGTFGFTILQSLILYTLITGALAYAISRIYLGQPISLVTSYLFGRRQYLSLILATLMLFLAVLILYAIFAAVAIGGVFALLSVGGGESILVGVIVVLSILFVSLIFFLGVAFIYTRMLFITQAVVLENQGPFAAIGRSWQLTTQHFWRTFGTLVAMGILAFIISGIPALLIQFGLLFFSVLFAGGLSAESQLLGQNIGMIAGQIGAIIALPLQFVTYTLLYYDLRIRKEGFDIELKSQQASSYA